jgi:hypothetical protein
MNILSITSRFLSTSLSPYLWIDGVKKIISVFLRKSFFHGHTVPLKPLTKERIVDLTSFHGAAAFPCLNESGKPLDVLSLCTNRNAPQGTIIFSENAFYQKRLRDHVPHQYEYFLKNGFEVILWNPTLPRLTNQQYISDLTSVLKAVKEKRGDAAPILLKANSAGVEPTLVAAAKMPNHSSLVLILDRGYADAEEMARSTTIVTTLPIVRNLIQKDIACDGKNKLQQFQGKIIWISPEDATADQMTYWPKTGINLTHQMQALRPGDHWIKLGENADHWSHWNRSDYDAISHALLKMKIIKNIIESPDAPARKPVSLCSRIMPYALTKAWF